MKKVPYVWELAGLIETAKSLTAMIDDKWVSYRPIRRKSIIIRIKAAWLVFTGKADAVIWPSNQ